MSTVRLPFENKEQPIRVVMIKSYLINQRFLLFHEFVSGSFLHLTQILILAWSSTVLFTNSVIAITSQNASLLWSEWLQFIISRYMHFVWDIGTACVNRTRGDYNVINMINYLLLLYTYLTHCVKVVH